MAQKWAGPRWVINMRKLIENSNRSTRSYAIPKEALRIFIVICMFLEPWYFKGCFVSPNGWSMWFWTDLDSSAGLHVHSTCSQLPPITPISWFHFVDEFSLFLEGTFVLGSAPLSQGRHASCLCLHARPSQAGTTPTEPPRGSTSSGPGALPPVPPGRCLDWGEPPSSAMWCQRSGAPTFFLWGQVYLEIVPKSRNNLLNETDRVSERRECFSLIQELDGLNSPGVAAWSLSDTRTFHKYQGFRQIKRNLMGCLATLKQHAVHFLTDQRFVPLWVLLWALLCALFWALLWDLLWALFWALLWPLFWALSPVLSPVLSPALSCVVSWDSA